MEDDFALLVIGVFHGKKGDWNLQILMKHGLSTRKFEKNKDYLTILFQK